MSATKPKQMDFRTKVGRREEILEQIREHEGFSIFWITENALRARVAEHMNTGGEIVTDNRTHGFPWVGAKISKQNIQTEGPAESGPSNSVKTHE